MDEHLGENLHVAEGPLADQVPPGARAIGAISPTGVREHADNLGRDQSRYR